MLSRRRFLQATSLVSLAPFLPAVMRHTALAAGASADDRTLVVIQLDGGNDGINTVVPYADDGYGRARVKLRLEKDKLHKLDAHVGLHPDMKAAKELFDSGRLSIVQGVGYPNPDRSHFRSMRIWQTARFEDDQHDDDGWLGRALDQASANDRSEQSAIYIGSNETPVSLWARRSAAITLASEEDMTLHWDVDPAEVFASGGSEGVADLSLRQFVDREVLSAFTTARQFNHDQQGKIADGPSYPDSGIAAQLRLISQVLKSNSAARVFYTVQSGYDTHAAQLDSHARLLRDFSRALQAFLDDLKQANLDDRVVVLAFSEFGRRVAENDSRGTDHGTAGPVFLAGSPVQGGLVGQAPSLSDLENGDLKRQFDFRQVYATLLDQWLGVSSRDVLGEAFESLPLLNV